MKRSNLYIGIDVGSTTVKVVVMDVEKDQILWDDYQRHEARQQEKVLELLQLVEKEVPEIEIGKSRVFVTGSGGNDVADLLGAKFVQEVNAVALAAEKHFPNVGSVIELGGQDSKIIIFKENIGGRKKKIPSMNDKCAGGTGAVLDKINAKLRIPAENLCKHGYNGIKIHHIAGKCGVFAESDINSLQKLGVPNSELMASLFDAIVLQNLTILTRGHTLRPQVLLLGGPNTFIKGLQEAWKFHLQVMWEDRKVKLPEGVPIEELIIVPENALYFAVLGAIEYGKEEPADIGIYLGWKRLEKYIMVDREMERVGEYAGEGLVSSEEEMNDFLDAYTPPEYVPPVFHKGQKVQAFIGLDAGSTSTKGVLLDTDKKVIAKAYLLSKGNPIEDAKELIAKLAEDVTSSGAELEILGLTTTGYAKDILKDVLCADGAIVETVAHTAAALHYYDDIDVICDVGGQDIKIMMLKDGKVKDFKLNTQCSAGNGYFLQSTSEDFNVPVTKYAETAFKARMAPDFAFGCAVFLQSDIVNFQRLGWSQAEILAGLAKVLPKNIWLYVAQISNFSRLGTRFLLQGGTQRNMAAVKAQVDFIKSRFIGKVEQPTVIVHKHCGESGAIGAALESIKLREKTQQTSFIGLEATKNIKYETITNEETRCNFCKNKCLRTFIDINTVVSNGNGEDIARPRETNDEILVADQGSNQNGNGREHSGSNGSERRRLIVGYSCEKGSVEEVSDMRLIKQQMDKKLNDTPNLAEFNSKEIFKSFMPSKTADNKVVRPEYNGKKKKLLKANRSSIRIGIPRVMIMFSHAPIFNTYFESLGIKKNNLVYSDYTTIDLYRTGAKRGSIDPCYPSKVSVAHVHNLLFKHHEKRKLDMIFFPLVNDQPQMLNTAACWTCPTVAGTPIVVKAAFTKEEDLFKERNILFLDTFVNVAFPKVFEKQMYDQFKDLLGLSRKENKMAVDAAYKAFDRYNENLRRDGRRVLDQLVENDQLGIVVLGRTYHNDPGINHGIFKEFQTLKYPILTLDSMPMDDDLMEEIFGEEIRNGEISDPFDISDVWKHSMNENSNLKIWAAKFVARHPNLVGLEMSSFKCGHDAPTYHVIEQIVEESGTPYFSFKDIDENKSAGSIKLRVETLDYFLKAYWDDKLKQREKFVEMEASC